MKKCFKGVIALILMLTLLVAAGSCEDNEVKSAAGSNTKPLMGIWGSSPDNVFTVGMDGLVLHSDGNIWNAMGTVTWKYLQDIWGSSSSNVFAVGMNGSIFHFDGTTWSEMESGTDKILEGVWGSSPPMFL